MKAPTSLFDRPGRATAVVGAVLAVSATAAVALLSGTATATPTPEQPGRCTKNVNVRAEPDAASRIVALCEEGTSVKVGEARDGFLRLTNLGGWAAHTIHERREGERAREQVLLALKIAGEKVRYAQQEVRQIGVSE